MNDFKTLERVRKWIRENGGNGSRYIGGGDWKFIDQFHGLRKILGMPTSEEGICQEWNERGKHHG